MKRLRTILQSKSFLILSLIFILLYILIFTKIINYQSSYENGNNNLTLKVIRYTKTSDKLTIYFKGNEKIIGKMYTNINQDIHIGDTFLVNGTICDPSNNNIPNTFNYKKYLYNQKIYKIINITSITKIKENHNVLNTIKEKIITKASSNKYLLLFIVGDKSQLESDVYNAYKNIGIAHLLAISGMHLSVFIKILEKILKYFKNTFKNFIIVICLLFYLFLISFSPSAIRVFLCFIIGLLNKKYLINLSNINILYLSFLIMIIYNPFYIYQTSFLYSYTVVFGIMFSKKYLNHNYFINLIIISIISLLFSLPITININYEINLLLIMANILLVPLVTFIIYPLCLITFIFPNIMFLLNIFTNMMEVISNFLNKINYFNLVIPKMNVFIIIIYYCFLILYIYLNQKRFLLIIILTILFNKLIPYFNNSLDIIYFDVGQGDSIGLIFPNKETILIDTGVGINYNPSDNIILYFKSKGITKLNYLIITHGDSDHMGESTNIVNNFKVDKVILNCGEYNDLESELVDTLNSKNIKYYSCIKEIKIDKYKLNFLYTDIYDNENDNSNVIYFNYNNLKFLFMGDASTTREEDILKKYNLNNIDFLKVGHHGSDTSSEDTFINSINPQYSIISVGKNNRYGHPKESVLYILNNTKIYRTDEDGSIEIKIKSDGYSIETCEP